MVEGQATAENNEPVYRGFEALSDPAFLGTQVVETVTPAQAANVGGTEAATTTGDSGSSESAATNVDGAVATEGAADVVAEAEKPLEAFKIPGVEETETVETPEQIAQKAAIAKLAEEQNWINLAKVKGVEITEDSFEAYNTALDIKFEADKSAAIEAIKKERFDLELNKLPVEAVAIIEGLKSGFTVEDVLAPVRQIEGLLALSNEELIAEDLRLQEWPEELIEKKINELVEADKIDLEAQPLRVILNNNKKQVTQNQVEKFAQLQQQRVEHENSVRLKESDEIKNTIVSMKTYMDVPITPDVVNHIQQKWAKGEYHETFKDPKIIAEFLMYKEFGEQGLKSLKNREYQRGRDEKSNRLHNIPPVSKSGAVVTPQTAQKAEGNFEALRR